jgi:hypothetical protein
MRKVLFIAMIKDSARKEQKAKRIGDYDVNQDMLLFLI